MKIKFLPLLLMLTPVACKVNKILYSREKLAGIYTHIDDVKSYKLNLNSDYTFLYHTPPSHHVGPEESFYDTIAYGTWSIESSDLLVLSSKQYLLDEIKLGVEESTGDNPDTVYIEINNPVEEYLSERKGLPRNIRYGAVVLVYNTFLEQVQSKSPSNLIKLYNPQKLPIQTIKIVAYPIQRYYDGFILFNYVEGLIAAETKTYSVKPVSNHLNHFRINIPDITDEFLRYRRLNREFIKIINKSELEWDGHIFTRETRH